MPYNNIQQCVESTVNTKLKSIPSIWQQMLKTGAWSERKSPGTRNELALVTLFVPSEIACLASSPGRIRRTAVWISRDAIVDFLEYEASSSRLGEFNPLAQAEVGQTGGFSGYTLENIVDKGIKNSHGLIRDTSIGVDLPQHCNENEKMQVLDTRHAPL